MGAAALLLTRCLFGSRFLCWCLFSCCLLCWGGFFLCHWRWGSGWHGGFPALWPGDAFAAPDHAFSHPLITPLIVGDVVIVIADTELEAAGRADLKGCAAGRAAGCLLELGVGADRANVFGGFHGNGKESLI